MGTVTPIRIDLVDHDEYEYDLAEQKRIFDRVMREQRIERTKTIQQARNVGRIEGFVFTSICVLVGFAAASFIVI